MAGLERKTERQSKGALIASGVLVILGAIIIAIAIYFLLTVGFDSSFFLLEYPLGIGLEVAGLTLFVMRMFDKSVHQKLDELLKISQPPKDTITVSVSPVSVKGNCTFTVSGIVTAASRSVAWTAVFVQVNNPKDTTVAAVEATVSGSGSSGAYSTTIQAGGGSGWIAGKYRIVASYGTAGWESPATAETTFDYFSTPEREQPIEAQAAKAAQKEPPVGLSEERRSQLGGMISERWASTLEDWTTKQSIDELYLIFGCHLGAIDSAGNQYTRLHLRSNIGTLALPEGSADYYRKRGYNFLKAYWSNIRKEACNWFRENSGVLGQALIAGLGASIAVALPPPWNQYPSVGAIIAVILIRSGLDTICNTEAQLPEPTTK
jgi:hypothetical protein